MALLNICVEKETVSEARASIVAICEMKVGELVISKALDALMGICSVNNTTVSGCTFQGGTKEES